MLVKKLEFSGWNPPPPSREIQGDFFYLEIKTLEDKILNITAFSRGFYKNKSFGEIFDPKADSQVYSTIIDLLCDESKIFYEIVKNGLFSGLNLQTKHINLSYIPGAS